VEHRSREHGDGTGQELDGAADGGLALVPRTAPVPEDVDVMCHVAQ
jgi:hypothetical protein